MVTYKRMSFEEREEISRLLEAGQGIRSIARTLQRNPSSISREINRFHVRTQYRAILGQKRSILISRQRRLGKRKILKNKRLLAVVRKKLKLYWSPDQIAKYLKAYLWE